MSTPMRIVVADAHPGFRHTLATLLGEDARLAVVEEVADLRYAGSALRRHHADGLVSDVNLLENGHLGPIPAGTVVIAVGMDRSPARRRDALRRGADAYIVKDRAHTGLVDALLG